MQLIPLHGATGFWDELFCLVIPLTLVVGVALALMRQEQRHNSEAVAPPADEQPSVAAVGPERAADAAGKDAA